MRTALVTTEIFVQDYLVSRGLTFDHVEQARRSVYTVEGVRFIFNAKSFAVDELAKDGHQDYVVPTWNRKISHVEKDGQAVMQHTINRALCVAHYQNNIRKMYALPQWFIITSHIAEDYKKIAQPQNCANEMSVLIHFEIARPTDAALYTFVCRARYVLDDWDFQKSDKIRDNHFKFQEDRDDEIIGSIFDTNEMVHLHGNLLTCGALILVPAKQTYTVTSAYMPTSVTGSYDVDVLVSRPYSKPAVVK